VALSQDKAPLRHVRGAWDAPQLSATQERFYRELMSAQQLPSPPEVAQKMLLTVNRDDVRVDALAKLIARDQSLTVALLRLANSAFFAIPTRVTSIQQAVMLLGLGRVRDLVLGLSIWKSLDGKDPLGRKYRRRMWEHTATVAAAAKMLAERTGGDGGAAFAAGLLHDVGKLILGLRLGASYWDLLADAASQGQTAAEIELATFGCHHGTVGGWLMQIWQLPPALVDPVALHHDPLSSEYGMDLVSVVAVADRLVNATDAESGVTKHDVLAEVREFAPGLPASEEWQHLYVGIAKEQKAVAGMFD
jgi:putative nucleotidyltransferase with HDIG domain